MSATNEHIDTIAASARGPWSEHAFDCARCPGAGCPAYWVGKWERASEDGVTREFTEEGCGLRLAQSMFVRVLQGTHIVGRVLEEKTKSIEDRQISQSKGILATLQTILSIAAKSTGNPAAIAAAPLLPRLVGAVRKMLPARKDR